MRNLKLVPFLLAAAIISLLGGSALFGADDVASANADVAGSYLNVLANAAPDLETAPPAALSGESAMGSIGRLPLNVQPAPPAKPDLTPANAKFSAYVVKRGDTLTRIAGRFGTTTWSLMTANKIKNANKIYVGQKLIVPSAGYFNVWQWQPAAVKNLPPQFTYIPPAAMPAALTTNHYPAVCNPMVTITSPLVNDEFSANSVTIRGSANLPPEFDPGSSGFSYYKLEFGEGERPIVFHQIGNLHYNTVSNGVLETWNTSGLGNAVYILRLIAVSGRGNFPAPCEVRVGINR